MKPLLNFKLKMEREQIKTKGSCVLWNKKTVLARKILITNKTIYSIIILLLIFSCDFQRYERDFFLGMKEGYTDIHISSRTFFVKSFGLAKIPKTIDGQNYWLLSSSDSGYFYLNGYIRRMNDSILLRPYNYDQYHGNKDYKLFDFNAKNGNSWKLIFKKANDNEMGDSVSFLSKTIMNRDTIYYYSFSPIYHIVPSNKFYYDSFRSTVIVEVSKINGIISLTKFNPLYAKHILLKAIFFPKPQFINNQKRTLDL